MSKKIERVARKPCDSQSRDDRRRTGYWNHRDTMCLGSRYEKMAGVSDEGRPTIGYKCDINSLL
ncbi:MAG: hypothetical protein NTAFB01_27660 [Nitrospira sp.]